VERVKRYAQNIATGKRWEIIKIDKEAGTITLKGDYNEFTEPYSPERMQRLGYRLVKEVVSDGLPERLQTGV
jgi:hypothetical protein